MDNLIPQPRKLLPESALYQIQHDGIQLICQHPRVGLFWSAGLGKTTTIGHAIAKQMESGEVERVLYVCPPRVIGVARRELAKWEKTAHIKVVDCAGTPARRLKLLQDPSPGIYCISYNNLTWLLDNAASIKSFQAAIFDETSKISDPATKTTKNAAKLAIAIPRLVILNGTPGDLSKIWSQVFVLDKGARLGRRYWTYLDNFCIHSGFRWIPSAGARLTVSKNISDICFSASAEDHVGDLPEVIHVRLDVELPSAARSIYEQMEADMIAELANDTITASNPEVVTGKLMQIADGILYREDGTHEVIHTAKVDALLAMLDECGSEDPALILYRYRATAAELRRQIPGAEPFKADTPAAVDLILGRWQRHEIPALIAHPLSIGHGIDGLQHGGNRLVWFGPIWSSDVTQQAQARLHRSGGRHTVIITTIVASRTIDEVIAQALQVRMKGEGEILDALSRYLRDKHPKQAASIEERIKAARARMQKAHPDRGGRTEDFIAARVEFENLKAHK
jgi:hypothetical protein